MQTKNVLIKNSDNKDFALNIANIANNILNNLTGKVLVMTGIKNGVGNSSIVYAVGEVVSDYKKVLVIEADFTTPSFVNNGIGNGEVYFDDYLLGKAEFKDALHAVNAKYDVLAINPNSSNLTDARMVLTNGSFNNKINMIKDNYDIVLIDAPSINKYDDAINLATLNKQIALVIESRSSRLTLKRAINTIDIARVELLGLIINKKHKFNIYS